MFGGAGADTLDGGAGRDQLAGGDGDDTYVLGTGSDWVVEYAAGGMDTVQTGSASFSLAAPQFSFVENLTYSGTLAFSGSANALNNTVTGGIAADRLSGGAGDDRLIGRAGADVLLGDAGNDVLSGGSGADRLDGGAGIDTATYASASARVVASLAVSTTLISIGDAKGDVFIGVENLEGSRFGDGLFGNRGDNILWGMDGDDRVWGRGGADTLFGGAGSDTFVFKAGSGADRVMDFQDNIDTLSITGFGAANTVARALGLAVEIGGNVVFQLALGDSFTILNTTKLALTDDLIFV